MSSSDNDYLSLRGLTREQFDDVMSYVKNIWPTKTRSIRTCVAIKKLETTPSQGDLSVCISDNLF